MLVLFVYRTHERRRGWQDLVDKDENSFFGWQLDTFADYVDKLTNSKILQTAIWHEIMEQIEATLHHLQMAQGTSFYRLLGCLFDPPSRK
jgi:hypothetical protein